MKKNIFDYFHQYVYMLLLTSVVGAFCFSVFTLSVGAPSVLGNKVVYVFSNALVVVLILCFWLGYKYKIFSKYSVDELVFYLLVVGLVVIMIRPIASNDLYTYVAKSRIFSIYGKNPYALSYDMFSSDYFYQSLRNQWSGVTVIYGPVFLYIGGLLTKLSKSNLVFGVLSFKILFLITHLVNAKLIYLISKSKASVYLYAYNPIILYEFLVSTHNDMVMMLFFLIGIYYLFKNDNKRNMFKSYLFVILSVFVKGFAGIYVPLYIVYLRYVKKVKLFKVSSVLGLLVFPVVLFAVLMIPFWSGLDTVDRYGRLLKELSINASPLMLMLRWFFGLIGLNGVDGLVKLISRGIFALFYVGCLSWLVGNLGYKKNNKIVFLKGLVFTGGMFFISFLTWFQPWYLISVMVPAAIYLGLKKDKLLENLYFTVSLLATLYYFLPYAS